VSTENTTDKEIKLKPRKHPVLWQAYKTWYEWSELCKRHTLRISAIERGASTYSIAFEQSVLDTIKYVTVGGRKRTTLGYFEKVLHEQGEAVGPIYQWLCGIKGINAQLASKLLALIDDIEESPTISSLWRYAGYAVVNGRREYPRKGEKLHYNKELKSVVWQVGDSFIRQHTPLYTDFYYVVKAEYQGRFPEPVCTECDTPISQCANKKGHEKMRRYTRAHIDNMSRRRMAKLFLSHLWLKWREFEGLPVSAPYAFSVAGHSIEHMIPPP